MKRLLLVVALLSHGCAALAADFDDKTGAFTDTARNRVSQRIQATLGAADVFEFK
jgi:hypothetical protein